MDRVVNKYYDGFEGEPEIRLIRGEENEEKYILSIWEGYFNSIMDTVVPEETGWTSLAYFYHLQEGWYEESPWQIPNIDAAIDQLKKIDVNILDKDAQNVLIEMLEFLIDAKSGNDTVWIAYE